ncbi:hypothetical protein [Bradyrhizobium sp. STM 3843]|uniref:hypothetical protein n=1 Tax=Bradyrhizobium sp. STM 3843 TaxID=551947 RepID=UPI00158699B5|nr:hypothetical protein [Bradyrhizobium sp. STM 3843]
MALTLLDMNKLDVNSCQAHCQQTGFYSETLVSNALSIMRRCGVNPWDVNTTFLSVAVGEKGILFASCI